MFFFPLQDKCFSNNISQETPHTTVARVVILQMEDSDRQLNIESNFVAEVELTEYKVSQKYFNELW